MCVLGTNCQHFTKRFRPIQDWYRIPDPPSPAVQDWYRIRESKKRRDHVLSEITAWSQSTVWCDIMTIKVPRVGRDTWSSPGGVSRCDKLCDSLSVCSNDVIVFHYSRYYKHQTHNNTHSHHLLSLMGSLVPSLTVIIFKIKRSWINAIMYNASPNIRDGPC